MAHAFSDFHDGLLNGIVLGSNTATIHLQQTTGEEYTLTLAGLEVLHMEDFRQGNIISMVEVVSGQAPYEHSGLERLFGTPHPSAAEEHHKAHAAIVQRQSTRIATGDVSMVVIVPSYGADLIAICRDVALAPLTTNGS
jgi:Trk K+ transport system NAD-binding subunit